MPFAHISLKGIVELEEGNKKNWYDLEQQTLSATTTGSCKELAIANYHDKKMIGLIRRNKTNRLLRQERITESMSR